MVVLALLVAVVVLDQAAKGWAWRYVSWTKINSGGDVLVGRTIGAWYAGPVSGALLDLLDFGLLSIAVWVLARCRVTAAAGVPGALLTGGWGSNLLDRLGIHYWTAPGSVRGVVDFIHIGGHYYNVADFFIIGCTPLFLLAAGYQGVREARRPVAARSVPPPARSPARARVRVSALAGAGLILVVALGAVNYGGVNAAPPHAGAQRDGHACSNRGRAAPRLLAGIQAPRHAPSQRAQGWPGPATPRTKCPFRPGLQFRVRLYVCGFPCHSTGNHKHMRSSSPSLVAQNATSGDIRGKTAWFARHAETSTKNQTRPWTH